MLKIKHYILHITAALTIAVMLCAAGHPAKGAGKHPHLAISLRSALRDTTDTLSKAADTLKAAADSPKAAADSLAVCPDSLTKASDSLSKAAALPGAGTDSLAVAGADSLALADSLGLFPKVQLTPKELKRKIRDSIWAYKDSVIRATPRLLETYLFADSIKNQRMFLWKTNTYFNTQELLPPDTTYNDNFNELPYKKYDVDAIYLGVAGSAMQYTNFFKRDQDKIFPFFAPYMPYTYTPQTEDHHRAHKAIEYRAQSTEYRVQSTELFALLIKLKQSDERVQMTKLYRKKIEHIKHKHFTWQQ